MLRDSLPSVAGTVPGKNAQELLKRRNKNIPNALCGTLYPICIKRGEGAMLEDVDGNVFIDFVGGVGVLNIGYSHPEVIEAVKTQSEKYFHTFISVVTHEGYVELAEKFNQMMPCKGEKKRTYFSNSGAEADENAIKIAKAYTKRSNIICFSGAFHGRTNLTMELTANKIYSRGMGPFPSGIYRAEYPYLYRAPKGYTKDEAIDFYVKKLELVFREQTPANEVAAIIIEPLQGEGGFIPAPIEWVKAVRKICDDNGILMISDEVQTGNCRTGRYFASEYWAEADAAPDIITTAKSMGAGLPISAITASEEIMNSALAGTIGGTYAGNPLACAAALKTIEIMKRDNFVARANKIADIVNKRYEDFAKKFDVVGEYRGLGAMIGIEFVKNRETKEPFGELVTSVVKKALQKGLIIEGAGLYGNVIRFLAPIVITDEQLIKGLDIFEECIKETLAEIRG